MKIIRKKDGAALRFDTQLKKILYSTQLNSESVSCSLQRLGKDSG